LGAAIYYTTNLSVPTKTAGTEFNIANPINVLVSTTIIAKAFKDSCTDSLTETLILELKVPTPQLTPGVDTETVDI